MILTGNAIQDAIESGDVTFDPFDPQLLNPNSINYRIGRKLYRISNNILDPMHDVDVEPIDFTHEALLEPNQIYLANTYERIGSRKYTPRLIGRSSLGRLGLFLQITADLGQLGNAHQWTLELRVVQPLKIYPHMKIGQVSFWKLTGNVESYYDQGYTTFNDPAGHVPRKKSK